MGELLWTHWIICIHVNTSISTHVLIKEWQHCTALKHRPGRNSWTCTWLRKIPHSSTTQSWYHIKGQENSCNCPISSGFQMQNYGTNHLCIKNQTFHPYYKGLYSKSTPRPCKWMLRCQNVLPKVKLRNYIFLSWFWSGSDCSALGLCPAPKRNLMWRGISIQMGSELPELMKLLLHCSSDQSSCWKSESKSVFQFKTRVLPCTSEVHRELEAGKGWACWGEEKSSHQPEFTSCPLCQFSSHLLPTSMALPLPSKKRIERKLTTDNAKYYICLLRWLDNLTQSSNVVKRETRGVHPAWGKPQHRHGYVIPSISVTQNTTASQGLCCQGWRMRCRHLQGEMTPFTPAPPNCPILWFAARSFAEAFPKSHRSHKSQDLPLRLV